MAKSTKVTKDRGNKLIAVRLDNEIIALVDRIVEECRKAHGVDISRSEAIRMCIRRCAGQTEKP